MRKKLSASIVFLSWILGLTTIFFTVPTESNFSGSNLQIYQSPSDTSLSNFIEFSQPVEIPGFKIDWKSYSKLNPSEIFDSILCLYAETFHSSYLESGFIHFDIKITFNHFFHPW